MWRLLQIIFLGHYHEWDILKDGSIVSESGSERIGHWYILQCKHCGDVKKKSLMT